VFGAGIVKFIGKALIVVLVILGVYIGYRYLTTEGPPEEFNHYREHVLGMAAGKLADEVAGTKEKPNRLLLAGNPKNRVLYVIRKTLLESGRIEVLDPEFAEDAGQSIKDWFFSAVRSLVSPKEARIAKKLAEQSRADAMLFVNIGAFEDTSELTLLRISYELQQMKTDTVRRGTIEETLDKSLFSLTYLRLWMWSCSAWVRVLIWFLVTLFAPMVTYKLAWAVMAARRNDYNAFLVAGYTVVDTFLAWVLLGFTLTGFLASSVFALALLGSATWSFLILDELDDMRP
jgi:hypothetical protein